MLTHFSLFTGIGGIDLAAEWAGFETVGQCEWADFPTKVLEKHWPDVPRWRDVRDVTVESVRSAGIGRVDLISGGYPCQPFSLAGKREGQEDERHLWPEMFRIIQELRPSWICCENVVGHLTLGLDDVLFDLESEGYTAQSFIIPACAVDAPHQRDRIFVVAYTDSERRKESDVSAQSIQQGFGNWGIDAPNVADARLQPDEKTRASFGTERAKRNPRNDVGWSRWAPEPGISRAVPESALGGVVDGVSDGLDGLAALGNAVVPQQVYPILRAIADIEKRWREGTA